MNEEAMLKIDAAIDEIENYVSGAHRVPLLEKVLVKDDELFHLMDNLRNEIPREVSEALEVCHRRDEIISVAQNEADKIIEGANKEAQEIIDKAKLFAQKTVDENVLVIQAKEEAMNVKNQTEESVKKLQDETTAWVQQQREETDAYVKQQREENEAYVKQLKEDAERYAVQMFDHVLANMNSAINAIHNDVGGVMQAMNQAKEQIHSANQKV